MKIKRKLFVNSLMENVSDLNDPSNIAHIYKIRKGIAKGLYIDKSALGSDGSNGSKRTRRAFVNAGRSAISDSIRRMNEKEDPISVVKTVKKYQYPTLNTESDFSNERISNTDRKVIMQVLQRELDNRKNKDKDKEDKI